ncbi:MAG: HAD family hydrolase [Syntrophales bacterium]
MKREDILKKEDRGFKAILFDFDGTLARLDIDFPSMRRAILDLIASYGVPGDGMGNLFALEMIDAGRVFIIRENPAAQEHYNLQSAKLIRDFEMEGAKTGVLFEGIREMLADLKSRGIRTAVVTRNCRDAVCTIFPDIADFCDIVVTRESAGRVKPDPEHLWVAIRNLRSAPENSVMVGDHPMDIQAGKKAGTYTVGVLTGYAESKALRDAGADVIIESAARIAVLLP